MKVVSTPPPNALTDNERKAHQAANLRFIGHKFAAYCLLGLKIHGSRGSVQSFNFLLPSLIKNNFNLNAEEKKQLIIGIKQFVEKYEKGKVYTTAGSLAVISDSIFKEFGVRLRINLPNPPGKENGVHKNFPISRKSPKNENWNLSSRMH
jgi:hypothetical protein